MKQIIGTLTGYEVRWDSMILFIAVEEMLGQPHSAMLNIECGLQSPPEMGELQALQQQIKDGCRVVVNIEDVGGVA